MEIYLLLNFIMQPRNHLRLREFDVHVNTIDHINTNIKHLLDIVNKDSRHRHNPKVKSPQIKNEEKNCRYDEKRYQQIQLEIRQIRDKLKMSREKEIIDNFSTLDRVLVKKEPKYQYSFPRRTVRQKKLQQRSTSIILKGDSKIDEINPVSKFQLPPEKELQSSTKFKLKVYPCFLNFQSIQEYIAQALSKQVQLDKKYDEEKAKFNSVKSQRKWEDLRTQLWEKGIVFQNMKQLQKGLFCDINQQELQGSYSIKQLAETYLKAEENWNSSIVGLLERSQCQKLNFTGSVMDLQNKGHISKQNLACFINLNAAKCYKGKHLSYIFQRFRGEEILLQYWEFMDILCSSK